LLRGTRAVSLCAECCARSLPSAGLLQDPNFKDVQSKLKSKLRTADGGDDGGDEENLEGDWQEFIDVRWTLNHARLLYMISKYAVPSQSIEDDESWIRQVPLTTPRSLCWCRRTASRNGVS
jgi:hypothetical protein